MQRISRVIDFMALPWNGIALEGFGNYRPLPDFNLLLVRPHIVKVAKIRCRATDEATAFGLEYFYHPCHHRWVEQHIVIKIMNVGPMALLKQKLSLAP